ncbi:uracil-DNA glycosylase-like [Adelges cooleyi]|uniref:uracil-DNA glycosylase-like n=1 Tax=Adelges cooleyi TaxID=133065 RepID=UPI00217F89B3|nr:uracil-DNA glycosylase-like [Adelges cooleyi]
MAQSDKDMVYFAEKYPRVFLNPSDVEQRWYHRILKPVFIAKENDLARIDRELMDTGELDETTGVFNMVSPNTSKKIWSFTHRTPLDLIKVIITGQDPYPPMFRGRKNEFESDGLAFSTLHCGNSLPDNNVLKRIFDAVTDQIEDPNLDMSRTTLDYWAWQGVLLLNTGLTRGDESHTQLWMNITREIVVRVCNYVRARDVQRRPLGVLLWGFEAKYNFGRILSRHCHNNITLTCRHPSAAADKHFKGQPFAESNGHFAEINDILEEMGKQPIDWSTVPEEERGGQSDDYWDYYNQ